MPQLEHIRPTEQAKVPAQSGFHAELHSIWGPPPPIVHQAGAFLSGVGEGLGQAISEGANSVVKAVQNPGEAIHTAATETGKAVHSACDATVVAGHYVYDRASHGDIKGVLHDAQKTGEAIGHIAAQGAHQIGKMNAHDLGKFVGHDVLPGAIATAVAPELAGESIALAASAASKLGTVVKEAAVLEKAAGVYEQATSSLSSVSEKIASKLEALQKSDANLNKSAVKRIGMPDSEGFEHIKPTRLEKSPVSDAFFEKVDQAKEKIEGWVGDHLERQGIKVHPVHKLEHIFGEGFERTPACWNPEDKFCKETGELIAKKGIYIAEEVWHEGRWQKNVDILFGLHHEVGHAICETLKTDWLSNDSVFSRLFKQCWDAAEQTDKYNPSKLILEGLKTREERQNEIFADMWSHLRFTPHQTNDYSQDLLRMFKPCMEYMQTKGAEWKAAAAIQKKL